jgi:DNA-binding transcriptional MocR family regulator
VQIDHTAADFPYIQLAGILRGRINTGKYAPGARLPTITAMVGETGLAPDTVRRAVRELAAEGLVRTVRGRGTFVRLGPPLTGSGTHPACSCSRISVRISLNRAGYSRASRSSARSRVWTHQRSAALAAGALARRWR